MTPSPHRLPGELFDGIAAGGGGAEAMRLLARAEHSRRLACLYAIRTAAREAGGAVAQGAESAWELLETVHRADPDAATAVLTHPAAGPALVDLLARLTRRPEGADAPVHRLTALAAAAAVRARVPARARWPLTGPGSWAPLPTLGRAHFPGARPGDQVELRVGTDGRASIAIPDAPVPQSPVPVAGDPYASGDRWRGARLLATFDTGATLVLDTLDPPSFPAAAGRAVHPDADEAQRWAAGAKAACGLLRAGHPETYAELAAGPWLLVPLRAPARGIVSGSSAETFGSMALSLPSSGTVLAVTMAHEMQHNKFAALLHLFDLFEEGRQGPEERYYAPWRPDPRPLVGLFHGAYAHLAVAQFWGRRGDAEPDPDLRAVAHTRFARWRSGAREATAAILDSGRLTPLGLRFAGRMLETLDALCRVPVPPSAIRRAETAARKHRAAWHDTPGNTPPLRV
ncbi:aKG-HExxH-type peptide beta-hydroxylase [Streptomyces sp. NRRL S-244]|uniref:aKG-HExxH-type peptide beta-hydroxylase n=1 Tax=Streptomyces sp. NRRL S-244 TaxID=1463897 RepID=UPI0004C13393|nr:HEXXH motif-containing putative peptide modification protein [Streptomyces sp. NRRL S-244]